jgi:hypothetical protein
MPILSRRMSPRSSARRCRSSASSSRARLCHRSIRNDSASAAKKPVAWTVRNRRLHPLCEPLPRAAQRPQSDRLRGPQAPRFCGRARAMVTTSVARNTRRPAWCDAQQGLAHPVMDELQPVPSTAPDRATLTDADQHKASAAEADRGLTRRGGKGGWPLDGENRRPRLSQARRSRPRPAAEASG